MDETSGRASDGWLLLSVLWGGKPGSDLPTLITTGDVLNRAVFTLAELQEGLARLAAGGLVDRQGNRYCATDSALRLAASPDFKRLNVYEQIAFLQKKVEELPLPRLVGAPALGPTRAEFEDAVGCYQKSSLRTFGWVQAGVLALFLAAVVAILLLLGALARLVT